MMFQNSELERAVNDPTKRVMELPGYPGAYVVVDLDSLDFRLGVHRARKSKGRRRVWGPTRLLLEPGA